MYRATDIAKQLDSDEAQRHLAEADFIILMVGLNEIRDGQKAMDIFNSIEANIRVLLDTQKNLSMVEIPPIAT